MLPKSKLLTDEDDIERNRSIILLSSVHINCTGNKSFRTIGLICMEKPYLTEKSLLPLGFVYNHSSANYINSCPKNRFDYENY